MMRSNASAAIAALLVCMMAFALYGQHALRSDVMIALERAGQRDMQTLRTEWMSGGIKRELTTTRNAGESDESFINRHNLAERAAFAKWPKDT